MDFKRPPKWKRRLRWLMQAAALAAGAGLAASYLVQRHRDAVAADMRPAGSFVTIEGRRTHFRLSGSGDFTFVLEAGLGDYSDRWGKLERDLVRLGRVFVYDRAGLGWSDSSPSPRTTGQMAEELQAVLTAARVPKPYVLVGHSLGGTIAVRFASDHRADVAGVFLIDPGHPDQFKRLPAPPLIIAWVAPQLMRAASFGLPQLLFKSSDPVQNQSTHVRTTGEEFRCALADDATAWPRPLSLGRLPMVVLTAADTSRFPGGSPEKRQAAWRTWHALHEEILAASSGDFRRHIVVEGATHSIHLSHPAIALQSATELIAHLNLQPNQEGLPVADGTNAVPSSFSLP